MSIRVFKRSEPTPIVPHGPKNVQPAVEIDEQELPEFTLTTGDQANMPELPESAKLPPVSLSEVSPWLHRYCQYSMRYSPEGYHDFHVACGLWALSTVAGRRVYVPLARPVYTPLSIALVARTSLFAKTVTARFAQDLLRKADLHWLLGDDETTPQKLLQDMAGRAPENYGELDHTLQHYIKMRLAMPGQLGWFYDEFNQLIAAMTRQGPMSEFTGLLRKLDDCPETYRYSTKGGGRESIEKPYLALLANTTPANLARFAARNGEFWNDGFWARFAFITPPPSSFVTKTMDIGVVQVPRALSEKLRDWNARLGVPHCRVSPILEEKKAKAKAEQDDRPRVKGWKVEREELRATSVTLKQEAYAAYCGYREALRKLISENSGQDLDGSYARLSDKALRIAALLASLENKGVVTLPIWSLAQDIAEMFRYNLHELYAQTATPVQESTLEDVLIDYLKKKGSLTARDVAKSGPPELRALQTAGVRELIESLIAEGIVEQDASVSGKATFYKLRH